MRKPRSNTFNLSHDNKMSCKMGLLVPTLVMECVPGDKFKISSAQMVRLAPMVAPIMHQIRVYTHYFFVPNRLVWSNWEKFITGGEDGQDTTVAPFVAADVSAMSAGSLSDYMGLPVGEGGTTGFSPIPWAAYNQIGRASCRERV